MINYQAIQIIKTTGYGYRRRIKRNFLTGGRGFMMNGENHSKTGVNFSGCSKNFRP